MLRVKITTVLLSALAAIVTVRLTKPQQTFFRDTPEEDKPKLRVRSTVVPESFDSNIKWDKHLYKDITVIQD